MSEELFDNKSRQNLGRSLKPDPSISTKEICKVPFLSRQKCEPIKSEVTH